MKVGICGLGDCLSYVVKVMYELILNFNLVVFVDLEFVKVEYMEFYGILMWFYDDFVDMLVNE